MDLKAALLADRLAAYRRLRGGFSVPLAGMVYWTVLSILGGELSHSAWSLAAGVGSGLIFPLAIFLAWLFSNPFMSDRSAAGDVLVPAFIAMLLFWAIFAAVASTDAEPLPLILAIGMSLHWPVIGWSYGRTALFSAHAIGRALIVLWIWFYLPAMRFTLLPLSVALVYAVTVLAVYIDSGRPAKAVPARREA